MRRFGVRRKSPPKPLAHKAPKLDVGGLATAYDWLLADRTLGMKMAVEWYQANIPALIATKQLDPDSMKSYDRAAKAAELGKSSTNPGEKQQAWRTALRTWERIFPNSPLAKVDEVEKRVEENAQPNRNVAAVMTVLEHLNNAFKKSSLTFQPTMDAERQSVEDVVWVPLTELASLAAAAPIKIALNEVLSVAKTRSIKTIGIHDAIESAANELADLRKKEADGVPSVTTLDGAKFMELLPIVLSDVSEWAVTLNGRALTSSVRRGKIPTVLTSAPGTHRTSSKAKAAYINYADEAVIHLIKSDGGKYKNISAIRFSVIKDGMTVREYKAATRVKLGTQRTGFACTSWFLTSAVNNKFITVV